jgi:class 3 adenylate cyclase/tetratricopeptide (TPR) repeat protein
MKCLACNHDNKNLVKFCVQCGQQLGQVCQYCKNINAPENRFCAECGHYLKFDPKPRSIDPHTVSAENSLKTHAFSEYIQDERKYVTVLFSDLCDYTTISEEIDPEEVKEILNQIFKEIHQIIEKYEGILERTMGDGVMVLFGSLTTHEDDAVRAIKTALEIHLRISSLGSNLINKIGRQLQMHSGISTGLVVTNATEPSQNKKVITGDTVNLASRLSDLAQPGEILVGNDTYRQSQGFFSFIRKPIGLIKGKTEDVVVYKVLYPSKTSSPLHAPIGLQASLIGRKAELSQLTEAAKRLRRKRGSIFSICGDAGTGKSRLIFELKKQLDLDEFLWIEGHAYPYAQKTPYFQVVDMLERIWGINEEDTADQRKAKISKGIHRLVGPHKNIEACIGTLHGFTYPETEGMSPELWNTHLYEAIAKIMSALAYKGKTIFCMEDLHWADTSTIRLLRNILPRFRYPSILLCSYRPPFALLTAHHLKSMGQIYQEIHLKELSLSESQDMMTSLLQTDMIPIQLRQFIKERTEGNPFYIEEMINSLLESNFLENREGRWQLNETFKESEIPVTVQGIIAARLDHLRAQSKRLLQEASVIGRSFPYEILKRITSIHSVIENRFKDLERIDLIRTRSLYPDLEFTFKHALTQEVGYNSLLIKERREIHERIACVMETLFSDRISEFYESLALHYRFGKSLTKAVSYLMKAGSKSLKCYALNESAQYFSEAYNLITKNGLKTMSEKALLIDLLSQWAFVYYYEGNYKELLTLLKKHQDLADQMAGKSGSGFFYAWMGCALWHRADFKNGHIFLEKAVRLSKQHNDYEAQGFASAWLSWTLTEKGFLADALKYAKQTLDLCKRGVVSSQYTYFTSLAAMGYAYYYIGNRSQTKTMGDRLIEFGHSHTNTRALCIGYCWHGLSKLIAGDLEGATENFQSAIRISSDPWYKQFPQLALCFGQINLGEIEELLYMIRDLTNFSQTRGAEFTGEPAAFFQGTIVALSGKWQEGVEQMERVLTQWLDNNATIRWTLFAYILAQLHIKLISNPEDKRYSIQKVDYNQMTQKADRLLKACIHNAITAGMVAMEGQIWLSLGNLHRHLGKLGEARSNWQKALGLFEKCDAEFFRQQALDSLARFEEV